MVANAGYGAADRLSDVLCSGEYLERICGFIPKIGPVRIQAAFTLPVKHDPAGEQYGKPDLIDVVAF